MSKTLLSILFVFAAISLVAQTGIISGRVVDEQKLPLPGATLMLEDGQFTFSDRDGYYTFSKVQAGSHTVNVTYIGFANQNASVTVEADKTATVDFELQGGVELNEVVVVGQLIGQAKALNQQATNANITNIIASDQVGRFPDANIGDALKRVPGISVQYDQGEARFGSIRGIAPQLNSVTINGERIPSAEAEIRTIQLDLIPSDMIQTIEVNKAVTPDMDADAIGASVNLVTRSAPSSQRISGTIGGGYNILAGQPTYNASLIYGNRFVDNRLGVILSASIFDNNLGSDNLEAEWTYDDANDNDVFDEGEKFWPEEIQIRQYYLRRLRQSYSASIDYKFNPTNTIYLKGIFNDRKDWETRYRSVFKDIEEDDGVWVAELERQSKGGTEDIDYRRLEDQKMMSFSLGGDHLLGGVKLTWSGSYSKASEDRPNERYFEITSDDTVPVEVDFSDPRTPYIQAVDQEFRMPSSAWALSEITEEFQYTEDVDINGRVDVQIPISEKKRNFVKVGVRYRGKNKERENDFYEYEPVSDEFLATAIGNLTEEGKDNFLAGDYDAGAFISPEFLGDLDLTGAEFEGEQDLSELAGNFNATENILAGYAMINQYLGDDFLILAGVRVENTGLEYSGFRYDDEEETLTASETVESDYINILPNLHLRYALGDRTILRAAYTQTLARPNYFDLVPYREIADGEELSIGNPDLVPTTSNNIDLMFEHYFPSIGIVSGGAFYKSIQDFIVTQAFEDYEFEGMVWGDFAQPINGGNATLFGAEVAFQRQLDFLPGFLKNFGLYLNYTFTSSEVTDFNFEGREDETIQLPGSPQNTLNASLAYDAEKFSARLSYNFASDFIDEVGSEVFGDRYYDKVNYLDFNMNVAINENWRIYLNANNLLNQPLRYFQGVSDRTMQSEFYNARFDLGVKFDFNK